MAKADRKSNKSRCKQPHRKLPEGPSLDDSPNWIPITEAHRLLCGRAGNRRLAATDLTDAMAKGAPSMRRCFGHEIRRKADGSYEEALIGPERELLPAEHWAEHEIRGRSDSTVVITRGPKTILVTGFVYFVWRPALAKLWPDVFASTPPSSVLTPPSPALTADPTVDRELPIHTKRGPKPYEWELFKAKFYLLLDDDDVPAHNDINVQYYADRLMTWGYNNLGKKATPEQASMRKKVAEWKPLWKSLKGFNK
jgi:hypothetical protein